MKKPPKKLTKFLDKTKGLLLLIILLVIAVSIGASADGECIDPQKFTDKTYKPVKRFVSLSEPNASFKLESSEINENGCLAYGAVRHQWSKKIQKVFGVVYDFRTQKIYKERMRNDPDVRCEAQKSSQNYRVEYLCYNPTVGAGETFAKKYAYNALTKQSFGADCRLRFGAATPTECSNWLRIK